MFILPILFSSCAKKVIDPISRTEFLLGTVCTVKIYDKPEVKILDAVFDEIARLEALLDPKIGSSEIARINNAAGKEKVRVSQEVFVLISDALEITKASDGAFNVAIGPLVNLWGIGTDDERIPADEEIDAVLPLLDYMDVVTDSSEMTVFLKREGMAIDLGAIAKGYIADRVAALLSEKGVKSALVNLGGNVYAHGLKPGGEQWKIGIQDPFSERNEYFMIYTTSQGTVVSSGIYERYFEAEGVRYHHILDWKTGYPVDTDLFSVSITGPGSETADALSTALFSLGTEKGFELLESFPGYDAVFVDKDKNVVLKQTLADMLEFTDDSFKVEIR